MFSSLRTRLWLTYALIISLTLGLISLAILFLVARQNPQSSLELRNAANVIERLPRIDLDDIESLEITLTQLDAQFNVRLIVIDPDRNVLVDTQPEEGWSATEFEQSRRPPRQNTSVARHVDDAGNLWSYISRPIHSRHFLVVAVPQSPLTVSGLLTSPLALELVTPLAQAGGIAIIASLLFAYLISRWVASPLQSIAGAARSVADGQRKEVTLEGPREVRALGQAFNEMTQKVSASRQSQRDFVANVSHELKTPLTSIQGFAQAILDGTANSPEALKNAAEVIYDESGRMHRLVIDLLDLARLDAGTADLNRAEMDLGVLLNGVNTKFLPLAEQKNIELKFELQTLSGFVGDGDRLEQVFTNLIDNAIKHTNHGGKVNLTARRHQEMAEISVEDNGPGIPSDEIERVFERFYQLDKSRKGGEGHGVGLGLAIANQIVHAHGGRIEVKSIEGKGSVFTVLLPFVRHDDSTLITRRDGRLQEALKK